MKKGGKEWPYYALLKQLASYFVFNYEGQVEGQACQSSLRVSLRSLTSADNLRIFLSISYYIPSLHKWPANRSLGEEHYRLPYYASAYAACFEGHTSL